MDILAEKTRQALNIGARDFQPSTIEAHQKMLEDCAPYAEYLSRYEKIAKTYVENTNVFLVACSKFLVDAPFPRKWLQVDLTQPAEAMHTPVPTSHAHLFVRDLHQQMASIVPPTVAKSFQTELLKPIRVWLQAYESAKERVSNLETIRLQFDAARRRLEPLLKDPLSVADEPRKLAEAEEKYEPVINDFQTEERQVYVQLEWLVVQASRLKAYLVDMLTTIKSAVADRKLPEGLLEPFPTHALMKGDEGAALLTSPVTTTTMVVTSPQGEVEGVMETMTVGEMLSGGPIGEGVTIVEVDRGGYQPQVVSLSSSSPPSSMDDSWSNVVEAVADRDRLTRSLMTGTEAADDGTVREWHEARDRVADQWERMMTSSGTDVEVGSRHAKPPGAAVTGEDPNAMRQSTGALVNSLQGARHMAGEAMTTAREQLAEAASTTGGTVAGAGAYLRDALVSGGEAVVQSARHVATATRDTVSTAAERAREAVTSAGATARQSAATAAAATTDATNRMTSTAADAASTAATATRDALVEGATATRDTASKAAAVTKDAAVRTGENTREVAASGVTAVQEGMTGAAAATRNSAREAAQVTSEAAAAAVHTGQETLGGAADSLRSSAQWVGAKSKEGGEYVVEKTKEGAEKLGHVVTPSGSTQPEVPRDDSEMIFDKEDQEMQDRVDRQEEVLLPKVETDIRPYEKVVSIEPYPPATGEATALHPVLGTEVRRGVVSPPPVDVLLHEQPPHNNEETPGSPVPDMNDGETDLPDVPKAIHHDGKPERVTSGPGQFLKDTVVGPTSDPPGHSYDGAKGTPEVPLDYDDITKTAREQLTAMRTDPSEEERLRKGGGGIFKLIKDTVVGNIQGQQEEERAPEGMA